MNKQTDQSGFLPRYELLVCGQTAHQRNREMELASLASSASTDYGRSMKKEKGKKDFTMQRYYRDEMQKKAKDVHTHLNNVDQLHSAERTGALKITKSSSGRKDIYTAITKEHYHQHNPETSSSTSNP